jgi:hypothetical protein
MIWKVVVELPCRSADALAAPPARKPTVPVHKAESATQAIVW